MVPQDPVMGDSIPLMSVAHYVKLFKDIQDARNVMSNRYYQHDSSHLQNWCTNVRELLPELIERFKVFNDLLQQGQSCFQQLLAQYITLVQSINGFVTTFKDLKQQYYDHNNPTKSLCQLIASNEIESTQLRLLPTIKKLKTNLYGYRKLYSDIQEMHENDSWFKNSTLKVVGGHSSQHAEMKILDYILHTKSPLKTSQKMFKIGISKLACAACYEVISYVNESNRQEINIRGFHGKIYSKWGYPSVISDTDARSIIHDLAVKLQTGQLIQQRMSLEQADTDTSGISRSVSLETIGPVLPTGNITKSVSNLLHIKIKQAVHTMLVELKNLHNVYNKHGISIFDQNLSILIQNKSYTLATLESELEQHDMSFSSKVLLWDDSCRQPPLSGPKLQTMDHDIGWINSYFGKYTIDGLTNILCLRINDLKLNNIEVLKASYINQNDNFIGALLEQISNKSALISLVLLNLYNKHAVGLLVDTTDPQVLNIQYIDSLNQPIPQKLKQMIISYANHTIQKLSVNHNTTGSNISESNLTMNRVNIKEVHVEQQKYNNCGPEVVENFIQALTSSGLPQEQAIIYHSKLVENDLLTNLSLDDFSIEVLGSNIFQ